MKKHLSSIILVAVFLVGLLILLYPAISDYVNSKNQSRAIATYDNVLANMEEKDYSAFFEAAEDYNARLLEDPIHFYAPDYVEGYWETLDITGTGIMGYIDIDKIKVELPIYHGTSDQVLNVAVGHLEGSALPIGGVGNHIVLSAHRGLPSATLFTDLDELKIGDTFTITVLDRLLTYEVNQILIVEPTEVSSLLPSPGRDYCTLVTCTPYGINTHRLLVRGKRIENLKEKPVIFVPADMMQIDPIIVTPAIAAPILLVLLIVLMVKYRKRKDEGDV